MECGSCNDEMMKEQNRNGGIDGKLLQLGPREAVSASSKGVNYPFEMHQISVAILQNTLVVLVG